MKFDLMDATVAQIHAAMREGTLTCRELVEAERSCNQFCHYGQPPRAWRS